MKPISLDSIFDLGIALSANKNLSDIFGMILNEAMDITECDAGTLYILKDNQLYFNYMITRSKNVDLSADRGEITIPAVPLGRSHVCACCALDKTLINIPDIYTSTSYDFSGAQNYDRMNDYRTASMLVVPMVDEADDCIGVLQLINAVEDGNIRPFQPQEENVIRALASFAAISLNNRLLSDEISELLHSFVTVMVGAIDTRSPYNANHTKSMVNYGKRFLDWLNENDCDIKLKKKDIDPFIMSIWLHDIGKLLIPLEIMDKPNRLGAKTEPLMHRITVGKLMARILGDKEKIKELDEIKSFITEINDAGFLPDDKLDILNKYSQIKCLDDKENEVFVIQPDELEALSIRKGTLTSSERLAIEQHVVYTNQMLSNMRFSGRYKNVPKYASSHHELLDGSGYPLKSKGKDLSVETRMLTILDVYDALTAEDRPYKPPMPPNKAFDILEDMAKIGKLDSEILALFKESRAWEKA